MKLTIRILLIVCLLTLSTFACISIPNFSTSDQNSPVTEVIPLEEELIPEITSVTEAEPVSLELSQPVNIDLTNSQETLVDLYEFVNPGVVALRVLSSSSGSLGSGFIIDSEGHIVTNYHVVAQQKELEVAFQTGYRTRGQVIGLDPDSDLAVLKVDVPKNELHPLQLGDSDQVKVGQMVIAIGNPFGLEGTMTTGIVSGLGRTVSSQRVTATGGTFSVGDVIQTDAAINPGNSGGPLLNLKGEVIGVNESILTGDNSRSNSGVGFAISVNMVKRIVPSLISNGSYNYPYLGIFSKGDLSLLEQEALDLPQSTGVYITEVEPGGPADLAGIRAGTQNSSIPGVPKGGDLIIAVEGKTIYDFNDLIVYITKYKQPGDTISLSVIRGGEQIELSLTLGERPN
jgi:S1-C subfamily serine protease